MTRKEKQAVERFDLITALYVLCLEYHSGQWSRGYRILSRIQSAYRPRNLPSSVEELQEDDWCSAYEIYLDLVKKYADKL